VTHPVLTCMRCGHEGTDVRMALADLEGEAKQDREPLGRVTVAMPVDESRNGPRALAYAEVPARYGNEPRCRDRAACAARVIADRSPAPAVEEEPAPWL
jgi:hypothetical protein